MKKNKKKKTQQLQVPYLPSIDSGAGKAEGQSVITDCQANQPEENSGTKPIMIKLHELS